MDLPFAQKRWVESTGVDKIQTVSDHKDASFGKAYGLLIKELRLLARAVLVVDQNGKLTYQEIVKELTNEPDYDSAIKAAKSSLKL